MIAFDNEIAAEGHEQIALVLYVFLLFLLDDSNFGHSFQGKAPRFVANWPDKLKPNRNRVGKSNLTSTLPNAPTPMVVISSMSCSWNCV